MSKQAMNLALEALEGADWYINQLEMIVYSADDAGTHENRLKVQQAITVMREALAEQPAQRKPLPLGQKQRLWSSVGEKPTLKDRVNAYGTAIEAAHGIKEKNA